MSAKNIVHPKGLYVLFVTEMWERFSYYGMRAIFMLYMVKALLLSTEFSSSIYGIYTSLVYLTPLIGGYIADKYWGNRKSILVGGLLMAIAQFMMFVSASFFQNLDLAMPIMFGALGLLIIGNGFFKPNISSMVGQLYPEGDSRIDSAFTIFYMGINAGALIAPLVTGGLGDTDNPADFKWGFLAAAVGMVIGTIVFYILKNKYIITPEGTPVGMPIPKLIEGEHNKKEDQPLTKIEKDRLTVVFIITGFVIAFWAAFEQAGASLTVFADKNTDRLLNLPLVGEWVMPASFFQSINPIFIILLAPIFVKIWEILNRRNIEPSAPLKMVIGLLLAAVGYYVIAQGVEGIGESEKISMFWLISMYFLHTAGELALSPVGLSIVNKLSPKRFASIMMAVFFLSSVVGNFIAGYLSAYIPNGDGVSKSILGYQIDNLHSFFMLFVFITAITGLILFLLHKRVEKMMHGIK